ncbi:GH116 family glycosyl hydrolase [Segetibacter koreensis]|uniref:GH116 family glycosyl hydrolase n=1 Tax=Segetibacter koreensis TaxID=398037 RepID=UPI000370CDDA|nr:GH116 family glycosyl hydrolase [Segetibacter koreensis]
MEDNNNRRSFLKNIAIGSVGAAVAPTSLLQANDSEQIKAEEKKDETADNPGKTSHKRKYNTAYKDEYLNRVAFPIGGIGAGMFCLEGTGAISHMSVRNKPEIFNEPAMFAAISVKGMKNGAKVLEGQVPEWKFFGQRGTGNGAAGTTFGLPRFKTAEFITEFPFCTINLHDSDVPLKVQIKGWSPFVPTDEDNSSLPVGAIEYKFVNNRTASVNAVFSYNSKNFLAANEGATNSIKKIDNGFVVSQDETKDKPQYKGEFAIFTDDAKTVVDYCWFRGGWWDPLTMAWNNVRDGIVQAVEPVEKNAPGASLYVPFTLAAGASKTIRVMMAWYVPETDMHIGEVVKDEKKSCDPASGCCGGPADLGVATGKQNSSPNYKPWYSSKFSSIYEVVDYWAKNYKELQRKSNLFKEAFYASTLPAEIIEAVAANLTIIKSPTVLRQYDGRLWSWEGCGDDNGCCHGNCTHVWNYAQAIPHLFPTLERTLRNTEFCENQNKEGHQGFRANLPISPLKHDFHAAADGQLGGIMKVHREWRIGGDSKWLSNIYPMVVKSMDYCIGIWDPKSKGVVEEPHHNTYDIEFWGPDGMCTSFYLGALTAVIKMGTFLQKDVRKYQALYDKGKQYIETKLYNGEYFIQDIEYKNLNAPDPATAKSFGGEYSAEAKTILQKEGPKYQYGIGCLSDGVLGAWIGKMCGLENFIDRQKVQSHLLSVHKYNLKKDLTDHPNPQRPSYALGNEGGLLLCTWPKGGKLSLPFVYSDEVWTGIEYQVASHLMLMGKVQEALDIIRACRDRYDGRTRNPFNEYECGHWYARAMSSYGMIEGLTGVRYDAVDKTLYIDSKIGDFTSFISTATGFGTVSLKAGKPTLKVAYGSIEVNKTIVSGKESNV